MATFLQPRFRQATQHALQELRDGGFNAPVTASDDLPSKANDTIEMTALFAYFDEKVMGHLAVSGAFKNPNVAAESFGALTTTVKLLFYASSQKVHEGLGNEAYERMDNVLGKVNETHTFPAASRGKSAFLFRYRSGAITLAETLEEAVPHLPRTIQTHLPSIGASENTAIMRRSWRLLMPLMMQQIVQIGIPDGLFTDPINTEVITAGQSSESMLQISETGTSLLRGMWTAEPGTQPRSHTGCPHALLPGAATREVWEYYVDSAAASGLLQTAATVADTV